MLSSSQYRTLEVLNIITALISLIAVVAVLTLMISVGVFGYKKKKIRIFHTVSFQKLSFYIISFIFLSDLFRIIGHLLPSPSESLPAFYTKFSCRPGAFFKLFGSISTFLWMNITSYIVYKLLLYPHKFDKFYVERIKRIFHCVSWPIALLVSIVPLASSQYTMARSDGPWCFIDTHSYQGMLMAFICYYLWLIVCWIIIILVYIAIGKLLINDYKKAKNYNNDPINIHNHNNIITKVPTIQRLQYFPLIFIFCWFWEILSISYNQLSSDHLFIIKILQISFTNLYGFLNTILFIYVIYNYNSNHVIHRNPKDIGIRRKKKKKDKKSKKTKKSRKSKKKHKDKDRGKNGVEKMEHKVSNASNTNSLQTANDDDGGGVAVTMTTTTTHHGITHNMNKNSNNYQYGMINNNNNNNNNDDNDVSGTGDIISLNVGNISVMSPTSISTEDRVKNNEIILSDIDDIEQEIDGIDDSEYEVTEYDDMALTKNVTIGYNEDESDEYYSDSHDEEGGVGVDIEEDTNNDDKHDIDTNTKLIEPTKDTQIGNGRTDRSGFSLLRNESNDIGDINCNNIELQYPLNPKHGKYGHDDQDEEVLHAINDENDAYS